MSRASHDDPAVHRETAGAPPATALPPHSEHCLGCGPGNPAGLGLRVDRVGDTVVADVVFPPDHVGAPGLAHGGAVATACDDVLAFMLHVVGEPAVTRTLQVDYLAPVVLGSTYRITARLEHRDGRRVHLRATGCDIAGVVSFEAHAVFVVVPLAHFERFGSPDFTRILAGPTAGPVPEADASESRVDP